MDQFKKHLDNAQTVSPTPLPKSDLDWVLKRVELMMSAYRMTDYYNPEGFIATMGAILEMYPMEVVEHVTDPKTGVQRRCKWPPTPADVVEACNAESAWREKRARYSTLRPIPRLPPPRFSAEDSYERMFAKYGRPRGFFERDGDKWNRGQPLPQPEIEEWRRLAAEELLARYPPKVSDASGLSDRPHKGPPRP